jgi:hypothetical protein
MARGKLFSGTAAAAAPGSAAKPADETLSWGVPAGPDVKPEDIVHYDAPEIFASGSQVSLVVNDVELTLTRPSMAYAKIDGKRREVVTLTPSAYVTMSVGSAKDLMISLGNVLRLYEKSFGSIETEFTRRQDKIAKK